MGYDQSLSKLLSRQDLKKETDENQKKKNNKKSKKKKSKKSKKKSKKPKNSIEEVGEDKIQDIENDKIDQIEQPEEKSDIDQSQLDEKENQIPNEQSKSQEQSQSQEDQKSSEKNQSQEEKQTKKNDETEPKKKKCSESKHPEKCMQKQLDKKFKRLLINIDKFKTSLKIICKNNSELCSQIFNQIDSFEEFRPIDDNLLITQAKKIAIENAEKVSDIAIKELSITNNNIKQTINAKTEENAVNKALEIVNQSSSDQTNEEILENVQKETEQISQQIIKEYFENMNKTTARKLSKINAVKLLASLFNQLIQIIMQQQNQKINLNFSCKNLPKKDKQSASDAQLYLYLSLPSGNQLIGETEIVKDTIDPDFTQEFLINYNFAMKQIFYIEVYDIDGHSKDYIGSCLFEIGQVVGSKKPFQLQLLNKKNVITNSIVQIVWEQAIRSQNLFNIRLSCENIKDIEFFSKSDPFLRIYRHQQIGIQMNQINQNDNWKLIYQTEEHKNNLNPNFKNFEIEEYQLCYNNPLQPLKVEVWDYSKNGNHTIIGYLFITLNEFIIGNRQWNFIDNKKPQKSSGILLCKEFYSSLCFDFLDYLKGGIILNTTIGIDFTLSNGNINNSNSLHYISNNNQQLNQYQQSIYQIVSIIQNYDIDKLIPVYGFGGKYQNQTSHCFPLNNNINNPSVQNVEGVMQIYQSSIKQYSLSGPTYFSHLINNVIQSSQQENNFMNYIILVIFTDGAICDMPQTIQSIIKASYQPISIIIVGVGKANFDSMEELDGDGKLLQCNGQQALRDIVQFVPMKKMNFDAIRVANETLKELPKQVVSYYRKKNFIPNIKKQFYQLSNLLFLLKNLLNQFNNEQINTFRKIQRNVKQKQYYIR